MAQEFSRSSYGLAIHTTSHDLGLAINNLSGDRRVQVWNLGRETSNLLHDYLLQFIQPQTWQDLKWLAVAKGPGGFTGTRIGVVTARTLAQQLDIPLFAISTLAGIAWRDAQTSSFSRDIAVQMRAQRGEVFVAIYRVTQAQGVPDGLIELLPDTVMTSEAWYDTLQTWQTPYHLINNEQPIAASVEYLLELASLQWQNGLRPHWSEALPFYGQHPVKQN